MSDVAPQSSFLAETREPLVERLRHHARNHPDAIAYREISPRGGYAGTMTYGELWEQSQALAGKLRGELTPGSAVMIAMPNAPAFAVAFIAALSAQCRALPIAPASAAVEVSRAVATAGVRAILSPGGMQRLDHGLGDAVDPAGGLILQSSGTTGSPGIAFRDTSAVDAVSDQMTRAIGFGREDRVLCAIPLCHSYGIEHGLLAPLYAGAAVHLCPGMNLPLMWEELCNGGVTLFPGTPSIYEMLSHQTPRTLPGLRAAYSAGAPLPRSVFDAFGAAFGVRVGQLYGATEVGSVTYNDPNQADFDPASVGRPMKGVTIHIRKSDDLSAPAGEGEEGQVCVAAGSMLREYVGRDASPFVDGCFPTADLGRLDGRGRLTITGRLKLLVDIGGLKVNPMEVEQAMMEHPAVSACVVAPIRQSSTIFRLKAVVTLREQADVPSVEALRQFAKERLSPHKVPRLFEIRDSFPRSGTGKILRDLVTAVMLLAMVWILPGCARESDLPRYPEMSDALAMHILADRGRAVQGLSGEGSLELTDKNQQTVRLEAAVVMRPPKDLHLRAWKFGRMVFDLTSTPEGAWVLAGRDGGQRAGKPAADASQFARAWSLLTFFDKPGVSVRHEGGQLIVRQEQSDGVTLLCRVDRATLTARQYQLVDSSGHVRFTLDMDRYTMINGVPWPRRMKAIGPDGVIELDLRDIELNGEIPAGAFVPPPHAQRLP